MSCKFVDKTCINCKYSDEYMVYSYGEPKNDFDAYKNYIDFDLQVCPNCGYISLDLEQIANKSFNSLKNTNAYKNAQDYMYLQDYLQDIDPQKLYSYPANLYECYAIMQEQSLEIDLSIRAYFRSVILKEAIVSRYQKELEEDFDEFEPEEIQSYQNLQSALVESIKDNISKIIELYSQSTKDTFIKIIYIECLLRFFKVQEAQDIYKQIESKIDENLQEYIDNLIEQRR
ncbi:MAG: hypothetical protein J6Q51_01330 [Clostridia bacterium]|nr:hypothetical protein [Clostridia bacterium]